MRKITYVIQAKYKFRDSSDWDDTNYDELESLKAAQNTVEHLSKTSDNFAYRILKQTREIVK